ncbi:MAG: hypothetical protein GDA48_17735 [Hormoscilla sp. GM102CHS1]|nr:hypothetical protein [Hormoscilla sp. GM102CHS1]
MFSEANLKKLDFIFGKASGREHNIKRSRSLFAELENIGIIDTPENRSYVANHIYSVFGDSTNTSRVQPDGRVVKESLLMRPLGGIKMETVWEGEKLITVLLKSGEK